MASSLWHWLGHAAGLLPAATQVHPDEAAALARRAAGAREAVEIGVFHGATTARLRAVLGPGARVTAIDPYPPGRLGVSFERWIAHREVARAHGAEVHWARATSVAVAETWRTPVDFLFVDGDHSWAGISADWAGWRPWVCRGGIVAFHDAVPVPGGVHHESERFVAEVVSADPDFRWTETVRSLMMFERVAGGPPPPPARG